MRDARDAARRRAPWLWLLFAGFAARVAGQALVAFAGVGWLPPMEQWQSGLLPYRALLAAQVVILALLAKVALDFTRGDGWAARPRRALGTPLLVFGALYFAAMVVRYPVQMALHPEDRWLGRTIPIPFHLVLATFVLLVGVHHRAHHRAHHRTHHVARGRPPAGRSGR